MTFEFYLCKTHNEKLCQDDEEEEDKIKTKTKRGVSSVQVSKAFLMINYQKNESFSTDHHQRQSE